MCNIPDCSIGSLNLLRENRRHFSFAVYQDPRRPGGKSRRDSHCRIILASLQQNTARWSPNWFCKSYATSGKREPEPSQMEKTALQLGSGADGVFHKRRGTGTGLKTIFPVLIALLGYGSSEQFLQVSAFQRSSFYHDVINFCHGFPLLVFAHYTDNNTLNLNPSPIQ